MHVVLFKITGTKGTTASIYRACNSVRCFCGEYVRYFALSLLMKQIYGPGEINLDVLFSVGIKFYTLKFVFWLLIYAKPNIFMKDKD